MHACQGAHNPKVVGSNPTPATIENAGQRPRTHSSGPHCVGACHPLCHQGRGRRRGVTRITGARQAPSASSMWRASRFATTPAHTAKVLSSKLPPRASWPVGPSGRCEGPQILRLFGRHDCNTDESQEPSFDLTDRVAVITGGSRGLGRHIAQALVCRARRDVLMERRPAGSSPG